MMMVLEEIPRRWKAYTIIPTQLFLVRQQIHFPYLAEDMTFMGEPGVDQLLVFLMYGWDEKRQHLKQAAILVCWSIWNYKHPKKESK